jgi:hypothetical protein
LTEQDLRNLSALIFADKFQVRLWPNEPVKKRIPNGSGGFKYIKDKQRSLPDGTADMIGRQFHTGKWFDCELKTKNDKLSKKQMEKLDLTIKDGGEAFVLQEINDEKCILINWRDKSHEEIFVRDYQ